MDGLPQIERGRRIKVLRAILDKNQQEFAAICGVSAITINLWEKGVYSGLSKKGAQKIVEQVAKQNITCSLAWLWEGIGNPPIKNRTKQKTSQLQNLDQVEIIAQETELFLKLTPDGVTLEITDDSMEGYELNDYVGGVWLDEIPQSSAEEPFIVELEDHIKILRKIAYDKEKKQYFLYANNTKSQASQLYLADAKIQRCAKVIRFWRMFAKGKKS